MSSRTQQTRICHACPVILIYRQRIVCGNAVASVRVLSKELEQKVACELWCRRSQVESDLCHHQNHLPDRLRDDGCGADNRAWMMSSRQSPTTMYRSWVWCTECSSLDVCGTLWTNLLPRTKNKATIEVFAGQPNEESVWETTTYCPSTRLVSRSKYKKEAPAYTELPFFLQYWRNGRVVMQRIANPCTSVRFRLAPPVPSLQSPLHLVTHPYARSID